jgi:hypothetical protein
MFSHGTSRNGGVLHGALKPFKAETLRSTGRSAEKR